jgi:hypothetical protein
MLSISEWRDIIGRDDLTDAEVEEFVLDLRNVLSQFLDYYFRDEFDPDDV